MSQRIYNRKCDWGEIDDLLGEKLLSLQPVCETLFIPENTVADNMGLLVSEELKIQPTLIELIYEFAKTGELVCRNKKAEFFLEARFVFARVITESMMTLFSKGESPIFLPLPNLKKRQIIIWLLMDIWKRVGLIYWYKRAAEALYSQHLESVKQSKHYSRS